MALAVHSRRRRLLTGLALMLAGSAGWTAVTLHGQTPTSHPPGGAALDARPIPAQVTADAIGDLRMFSATSGWAQRLRDGAVLHTTSGVIRWSVASPPTRDPIVAVFYDDTETARALTMAGEARGSSTLRSWATADGGAIWREVGSFSVHGFSAAPAGALNFVDPLHGWFSAAQSGPGMAGTVLYRTLDGGADWTQVARVGPGGPAPAGSGALRAAGCVQMTATFINPTTGWLTGSCAVGPPPLYVSHDQGQTWAEQPLPPISGSLYREVSFPPTFTSSADATLLTEDIGLETVGTRLFGTTDGGRIWTLRYSGTGVPLGTAFVDAEDGWLLLQSIDGDAADPDLYTTSNGGSAWSAANALPLRGVSLDFVTARTGWASTDLSQFGGGPSYLLGTMDGGRAWTGLRPSVAAASPRGS